MKIDRLKKYFNTHPIITFTIVFMILFILGQVPFELKDGTFNLKGFLSEPVLFFDALKQHILFLYDYVGRIKDFILGQEDFPIYGFHLGFGGDFLYSYAYYSIFDPLTIIAYIIPLSRIGLSYFIIMTLRVYLSGLFMMILARMLGIKRNRSLIIIGLIYAFSFPILYSVYRHAFFINGPMYLPLLMIGSERILKHKRPLLFIMAVFLSAISQFYFFVYIVFGFGLYWVFRIFGEKNKADYKVFFKIIFYAFIGVLMASIALVPTLIQLLEGSRAVSKGWVLFNLKEVFTILSSYIVPIRGVKYTTGFGSIFLVFSSLLFIFSKKTPHNFIKWNIIILTILSFSSLFAFFINGFTYVNNRWLFIVMVPVVLAFGFIIDGQVSITKESLNKSFKTLLIIILINLYLLIFMIGFQERWLIYIVAIGLLPFIVILIRKTLKLNLIKTVNGSMIIKKLEFYVGLMMMVTLVFYGIYYMVSNTPKNGFEVFYPNVDVYDNVFKDDSFYRVEQKLFDGGFDKYSNDSIRYDYYSTHFYNSMSNGYVNEYFNALDITNLNGSTGYNGLERRSILMSINQVKYLIIRESEKSLPPYGFVLVDTISIPQYSDEKMAILGKDFLYQDGEIVYEDAYIYENQNYINFGYMMYDSLSVTEFYSLDLLTRHKVLLDHVVIENGGKAENIDSQKYYVVEEDIQIEQGVYTVTIPKIENQEIYILLEGIRLVNQDQIYEIMYESKDLKLRDTTSPLGANTYKDNLVQLVNMGYYENEEDLEIDIKLSQGTYTIDKISYALLDMDNLHTRLNEINLHTLTNLQLRNDGFTGDIDTPRPGFLVVTLPFSEGFSATIDGENVEILRTNLGFMSVEVPMGSHEIQFTYFPPGLMTAFYLAGLGFFLMGLVIFINRKKSSISK